MQVTTNLVQKQNLRTQKNPAVSFGKQINQKKALTEGRHLMRSVFNAARKGDETRAAALLEKIAGANAPSPELRSTQVLYGLEPAPPMPTLKLDA